MLLRVERNQHRPEQRTAREVEGPLNLLADHAPQGEHLLLPCQRLERNETEGHGLRIGDALYRVAIPARERGAQRLVPTHQISQGAGESVPVERTMEPASRCQAVNRCAWIKSIEEPQALLSE